MSEHASNDAVRANLWWLLSRAFCCPRDMDGSEPGRLMALSEQLMPQLRSRATRLAEQWQAGLADAQPMLLAYARLFLGPFEILAPPYASFYLEPDQRLMGPISVSVAEAYADAGLEPGPGPREAPDHVSLEFEFLYYLTHRTLTSEQPHWARLRSRFAHTHMAAWIPRLGSMIVHAETHPFYNELGALLAESADDPSMLFGPADCPASGRDT